MDYIPLAEKAERKKEKKGEKRNFELVLTKSAPCSLSVNYIPLAKKKKVEKKKILR